MEQRSFPEPLRIPTKEERLNDAYEALMKDKDSKISQLDYARFFLEIAKRELQLRELHKIKLEDAAKFQVTRKEMEAFLNSKGIFVVSEPSKKERTSWQSTSKVVSKTLRPHGIKTQASIPKTKKERNSNPRNLSNKDKATGELFN